MNQEQFDEMIRHNGRLVRTANDLRAQLMSAVSALKAIIDAAEPIAGQHDEGDPVEYVVPVEDLDNARAVCAVASAWDAPRQCYVCGADGCSECGGE